MAQDAGINNHDCQEFAQRKVQESRFLSEKNTIKGRIRKRMRKAGFDESAIDTEVTKALEAMDKPVSQVDAEGQEVIIEDSYMFKRFVVIVEVLPPTRRRSDPPNLYPTVKALVDGLTDSGWWEDDDYTQLVQMSFQHGGLSDIKDNYKVILHVIEVDDTWIDQLMMEGETL